MSSETYSWLKVAHVFGFTVWIGTLIGALHILKAHAAASMEARSAFLGLEKGTGIVMDIGATLTIAAGVLLLVLPEGGMHIFKAGGFFHLKLTLVAVLVGVHVLVRRKMRLFRGGQVASPPPWLVPLTGVVALLIIVAIIVRPFAK